MRHRNVRTRLNRTSEHRLALMKSLSAALVRQGRIRTTHVKAMQLRGYLEPLLTLAKRGDLHARRLAFSRLGKKDVVHAMFEVIAPRIKDRPGGFLRVVKDGQRMGDGALMAYVEFVDELPRPEAPAAPTIEKKVKRRLHERRKELRRARAS